MAFSEYDKYDALGLGELVRTGEVSARELVETAIARIEQWNPHINAVVARRFDQALADADRLKPSSGQPFAGVPFLIKDLKQPHPDMALTCGSRFLRHDRPTTKSTLLNRMEAAGVIVLGRSASPEFGLVGYTEPELHGPCRNPWNLGHTPGGSSGGAAAVVASGLVPMAQGGDGGGSIRIPASCCGLFGLKPSRGRNPIGPGPAGGFSSRLSVEHVLTRTVRDSAAMLDITKGIEPWAPVSTPGSESSFLAGLDRPPERLKIALLNEPLFNDDLEPACKEAVEQAARHFASLGHEIEPAFPNEIDRQALAAAFLVLWCSECAHGLQQLQDQAGRRAEAGDFEATTWVMALVGGHVRGADVAAAVATIHAAERTATEFLERFDMMLMPTLASPPPVIGAFKPTPRVQRAIRAIRRLPLRPLTQLLHGRMRDEAFHWVGYTPFANITGQPAMTLPLHWTGDGLPVGVQLVGRIGEEQLLLRFARQVEQAHPWFDRRPALR